MKTNQRIQSIFFFFFSKAKRPRARFNPTHLGLLLRGGRRNYWKTRENASNIGKKRKELSAAPAPATHSDRMSLRVAGENTVGWKELVECACKFNGLGRSHQHNIEHRIVWASGRTRRRKEKRRQGKEEMLLFSAQGGQTDRQITCIDVCRRLSK